MKVILPDGKELELADGASGLDAARAIGPKLAEQAVLVKVDDEPRDLRLPLPDGARIKFLTTRDREDPDALYVLVSLSPDESDPETGAESVRAWRIVDGQAFEVVLEVG